MAYVLYPVHGKRFVSYDLYNIFSFPKNQPFLPNFYQQIQNFQLIAQNGLPFNVFYPFHDEKSYMFACIVKIFFHYFTFLLIFREPAQFKCGIFYNNLLGDNVSIKNKNIKF